MIEWINSWVQNIIIVIITSTIIEMILPEGNSKKYVKTIIGIYLVFTIVYPILTKISGKEININKITEKTMVYKEKQTNEIEQVIDTNTYVENTYRDKVVSDIKEKIQEKGYLAQNIKLEIETQNEDRYGQILKIEFTIEKIKEDTENQNKIEKVNIVIGENIFSEKEENITDEEIESLKKYLNSIYYTDNILIFK